MIIKCPHCPYLYCVKTHPDNCPKCGKARNKLTENKNESNNYLTFLTRWELGLRFAYSLS